MKQRLAARTEKSNNKQFMKKITNLLTVAAVLGCLNFVTVTASAQGSLTPPSGAPAPVMKSLDQVEARKPLIPGTPGVTYTDGRYIITQPGSYYLTGNLIMTNTSGLSSIFFNTNHVTLDLNGYTIFGTAPNMGEAIQGYGFGYRVLNGHIVGATSQTNGVFTKSGFIMGININSSSSIIGTTATISDVTVIGVRFRGISVALDGVVERCLVDTASEFGIFAGTVRDSRAMNTGKDAIRGTTVVNCTGKCVGYGNGISQHELGETSVMQNSTGEAVSGTGILTATAVNCRGTSGSGIGLSAVTAQNCFGESISGIALSVHVANSCSAYRPMGLAIQAYIGIGCYATYGTNQINHKYNMP